MKMDDSQFEQWYDSAPKEDNDLHDRLYDFGDYFSDMLFEGAVLQMN